MPNDFAKMMGEISEQKLLADQKELNRHDEIKDSAIEAKFIYDAYIEAGFNKEQAIDILFLLLRSTFNK